jgi:hypothetical protein
MINEFTICLHCGCDQKVVGSQIEALKPLESEYKIKWNNRIDRHPEVYESYSELINHSVATSSTEFIILINDRSHPTVEEVKKMLRLLEEGFACVLLYNVGFMGFSKELIRKIGWWDQRFIHGGWEDVDWVFRICEANLALYESQESKYDQSWKSPLNFPWGSYRDQHFKNKYKQEPNVIRKLLAEENYPKWQKEIGEGRPDISSGWKSWSDSILGVDYDKPESGLSGSSRIKNRRILS